MCYELDSSTAILMLKSHGYVSVRGKVLARCVSGGITIHGFAMNSDVGWQKIFSPATYSLLVIKAADSEAMVDDDDYDWMTKLGHREQVWVNSSRVEYPVIVMLRRLVSLAYDFVLSNEEFEMLDDRASGTYLQSVDVTFIGADSDVATVKEPESFTSTAAEFVLCAIEGTPIASNNNNNNNNNNKTIYKAL